MNDLVENTQEPLTKEDLADKLQRMWDATGDISDPVALTKSVLLLGAELAGNIEEIIRALRNRPEEKCTCLTELTLDAYGPGGPMSGHSKPPSCELHRVRLKKTVSQPRMKC